LRRRPSAPTVLRAATVGRHQLSQPRSSLAIWKNCFYLPSGVHSRSKSSLIQRPIELGDNARSMSCALLIASGVKATLGLLYPSRSPGPVRVQHQARIYPGSSVIAFTSTVRVTEYKANCRCSTDLQAVILSPYSFEITPRICTTRHPQHVHRTSPTLNDQVIAIMNVVWIQIYTVRLDRILDVVPRYALRQTSRLGFTIRSYDSRSMLLLHSIRR
jgi:hypothetical protein